ncbi:WhiB family transcriptional regulator [Nocardia sp. NPDC059239]|uniref:WhiB family transcriptional regulator n=1 Tax=unclassified Nocardia TaxID=2637762 RepID=UPI003673D24B
MSGPKRPACNAPGVNPELWDAEGDKRAEFAAKEICVTRCEIRLECGTEAVRRSERRGIHAGYNLGRARERKQLRAYVGIDHLPSTAETTTAKPTRTVTCPCGREFLTRSPHAIRCQPCIRDLVDAAPVAAHLSKLRAEFGWTYPKFSDRTGISLAVLKSIPNREFIQRARADRLLDLPLAAAS